MEACPGRRLERGVTTRPGRSSGPDASVTRSSAEGPPLPIYRKTVAATSGPSDRLSAAPMSRPGASDLADGREPASARDSLSWSKCPRPGGRQANCSATRGPQDVLHRTAQRSRRLRRTVPSPPSATNRSPEIGSNASGLGHDTDVNRTSSTGAAWSPSGPNVSDRSEEHTSELQSLMRISYAGFRLKKKTQTSYILIDSSRFQIRVITVHTTQTH